jgi:hypothetical protein
MQQAMLKAARQRSSRADRVGFRYEVRIHLNARAAVVAKAGLPETAFLLDGWAASSRGGWTRMGRAAVSKSVSLKMEHRQALKELLIGWDFARIHR